MFGFGTTELIIILVLILVIFGAGKLPEIAGALGRGMRSFRRAARDAREIDVTPKGEERAEKTEEPEQVRK